VNGRVSRSGSDAPYPLKLQPVMSRRIWGGSRLQQLPGLLAAGTRDPGGRDDPVGESWQVYGGNLISNGALKGKTLQQAASLYGAALLGSSSVERYGMQFPLLAKLIDAQLPLSLQVHPDDAHARTYEAASGHLGKAEGWVILSAAPGATIIRGFHSDVTAGQVRQAVQDGTVLQLMNVIPVQAGDVIYNPPGMVHAIGAGILLYELQQSSDLTYRLYDYGRRDGSGQPRELHLEQALAVAQLQRSDREPSIAEQDRSGRQQLHACGYFVLERLTVPEAAGLSTGADSLQLLTCTSGSVTIESSGHGLQLLAGESAVLPASLGAYRLTGSGVIMRGVLPQAAPEAGT
jgi:mannose-6-phosphate isomerase